MPDSDAFEATFKTLRKVLKPYEDSFTVIADEPGRYYLTSKAARTKSGSAIWFGGVEIKKNYVSFHLIPVYAVPALLKDASPAHVKELTALTHKGFVSFIKQFR